MQIPGATPEIPESETPELGPRNLFSQAQQVTLGFPSGSAVKNPPATVGDTGDMSSIPGLGRSPGGGCGNPLQYSCLENPMERGAWRATVHGITKSGT